MKIDPRLRFGLVLSAPTGLLGTLAGRGGGVNWRAVRNRLENAVGRAALATEGGQAAFSQQLCGVRLRIEFATVHRGSTGRILPKTLDRSLSERRSNMYPNNWPSRIVPCRLH